MHQCRNAARHPLKWKDRGVAREGSLLPYPLNPQKAKNICFLGDLCLVNRIWKLKVSLCPPALAVGGNDGHVCWLSSENVPK